MSSEWPLVRLKDITSILGDGLHGTPTYDPNGEYFFINGNNLNSGKITVSSATKRVAFSEYLKHKKNLSDRTILVSINGTLGNVAFYGGEKVVLGKSACYFNVLDDVDKHFVRYVLESNLFQDYIQNLATGSTIKNVSLKLMRDFEFALPPIYLQHRISAVLAALDDRITLLRETNATLEAIAQALFKSWFVDFDPVRAKMAGRAPEGMDDVTASLFPDSLEETELGLVPTGWRVGCLADIAKTSKKSMNTADFHDGINYVGLEHIPRKSLSLTEWGVAAGLESNKSAFAKGDVLFGKLRPYFHKVVVAPISGVCSTDILVCQPTQPEHHGVVTMHLFSDALISYADRLSNGAKMPRVNWGDLAEFPITVPPTAISKAYAEIIEPLLSRMSHNTLAARNLATLRDTLLPRLISGQLRLPEAMAELETA